MANETEARLASPGGWGWYGSSSEHLKYLIPAPNRRKRCWHCPRPSDGRRRPAATHLGMCNGVCLTSGCEWHMRQWAREADHGHR